MDRANEQLARHYEREAESTRHSLATTLHELNARLTPGHMFDEVMSYARGGGGSFARAFSNAVRDNPFPALLIGTGCMLFLSERMGLGSRAFSRPSRHHGEYDETRTGVGRFGESPKDDEEGIGTSVKQKASDMASGVKQGISSVGEKLSDASQRVRDTASNLGEGVAEAVDQAKERAQGMREKLADTAVHAGEQARSTGRQIAERTSTYMHEQPLIMTGLGLALGAAIAALLPSTRIENELMGRTADNIKKKIGDAASQQFEAAKESASEFVQKAKDVAEREGLTPSNAAAEMVRKMRGNEDSPPSAEEEAAGFREP
jgi:ElaB/YqjD/DUF883 family membrane-anchored ribosome-binding protein